MPPEHQVGSSNLSGRTIPQKRRPALRQAFFVCALLVSAGVRHTVFPVLRRFAAVLPGPAQRLVMFPDFFAREMLVMLLRCGAPRVVLFDLRARREGKPRTQNGEQQDGRQFLHPLPLIVETWEKLYPLAGTLPITRSGDARLSPG